MFCIHGGDGGVLFYRNLMGQLSRKFPLHAIESLELSSSDAIEPTSVKETAEAYVQHVLARHPNGPFRLAGYSFGGLVAHEMAHILESMGHRVDFVGLFDTHSPTAESRAYILPERLASFWRQHQEIPLPSRLIKLGARFIAGIQTNRQVRSGILRSEANGPAPAHSDLRRIQVRESNWKAMKAYSPETISARLTLFKAIIGSDKFEWPTDYGWSSLTRSGLDIVPVPGQHLTLFEPENITALAKALETSLDRILLSELGRVVG
jgi:thioesterase domain-containing protein